MAKKRKAVKKKTTPVKKATAVKKKTTPAKKATAVKKKATPTKKAAAVKTEQDRDPAMEFFRRARSGRFFPV